MPIFRRRTNEKPGERPEPVEERARGWYDKHLFLVNGRRVKDAKAFSLTLKGEAIQDTASYDRDKVDTWVKLNNAEETLLWVSSAHPPYGRMSNYQAVQSGVQNADAVVLCIDASTTIGGMEAMLHNARRALECQEQEEGVPHGPRPVMFAHHTPKSGQDHSLEAKLEFAKGQNVEFMEFGGINAETALEAVEKLLFRTKPIDLKPAVSAALTLKIQPVSNEAPKEKLVTRAPQIGPLEATTVTTEATHVISVA